ncbi:polysaccharide deacetylase family protein [Streptomyces sp. A 4/2]|uniref:polysaccharide deacetylase family protein n=1 Tax=Streptomyces sp. A 4/2 TaxID=2934314 RepID=UPI0020242A48|nr:polysaccharide deacetylase family protein [Streptomyces sp. A 4/2]
MQSDHHTKSRRQFLTAAIATGVMCAAFATDVLNIAPDRGASRGTPGPKGSGTPSATPTPSAPVTGAAGPAAVRPGVRQNPEHFRLRAIAGDSSMGVPPAHAQVRTSAEYVLPAPKGRRIALTFDDGPHPVNTPQVLAVLRKYRIRATFFVIGENATAFPELLHAVSAEGHQIANHSYTHPQLTKLSGAQVRDQLGRTSEIIEKTLGAPPRWCRAPYGDWNAESLAICADLGMEPLGWNIDTNDWARPGVSKIEQAVLTGASPGSVILQHDGGGNRDQTVQAVADYLPQLLAQDYEFVLPYTR